MLLVIIFMGYGLIKVPMRSWSGRTLEHNLSYCHFNAAKSMALRNKLLLKLEEKYTVSHYLAQVLNVLLKKYRRFEKDGLELYYLKEIHASIPNHIVIEIESKYKSSQEIVDKHMEEVQTNIKRVLSVQDIVDFSANLKHLVYRYNLNKSKYREMVADAVYYDKILEAMENNEETLSKSIAGFYGKNWLFRNFPKFGRRI